MFPRTTFGVVCWRLGLYSLNTLRPWQNGRHFADDMFKCIFLNVNVWIPIEISLTFVPKGSINNIPALFQIMVWRRPGDKPLSEPMMVSSLTHICVTRPQWVKQQNISLQDLVKSQSSEIWVYTCRITLKFDRCFDSSAAGEPVKFRSNRRIWTPNLVHSRLIYWLMLDVVVWQVFPITSGPLPISTIIRPPGAPLRLLLTWINFNLQNG